MKVKVFFVLGTDSSGKEDIWIRREAREFCDVIQVTIDQEEIRMLDHVSEMLLFKQFDFLGTYDNLTLNSISAIKMARAWGGGGGGGTELDFIAVYMGKRSEASKISGYVFFTDGRRRHLHKLAPALEPPLQRRTHDQSVTFYLKIM